MRCASPSGSPPPDASTARTSSASAAVRGPPSGSSWSSCLLLWGRARRTPDGQCGKRARSVHDQHVAVRDFPSTAPLTLCAEQPLDESYFARADHGHVSSRTSHLQVAGVSPTPRYSASIPPLEPCLRVDAPADGAPAGRLDRSGRFRGPPVTEPARRSRPRLRLERPASSPVRSSARFAGSCRHTRERWCSRSTSLSSTVSLIARVWRHL